MNFMSVLNDEWRVSMRCDTMRYDANQSIVFVYELNVSIIINNSVHIVAHDILSIDYPEKLLLQQIMRLTSQLIQFDMMDPFVFVS